MDSHLKDRRQSKNFLIGEIEFISFLFINCAFGVISKTLHLIPGHEDFLLFFS